jgi:hypothetical protein
MEQSKKQFSHEAVAKEYVKIYENMLARPLVHRKADEYVESDVSNMSAMSADFDSL